MVRRFIAGAVCPSCQEQDRIVVESMPDQADKTQRRCVSCGFAEEQTSTGHVGGVPRGRPERPKPPPVQERTLRILDPARDKPES